MRETTNNGKLASGGLIYFYLSGTTTPATVYTDPAMTIPASWPVVCDASGYPGALYGGQLYRMLVKDSTGAQIVPAVDGVAGVGIGPSGNASNAVGASVLTYNDLRALNAGIDYVYVCGRSAEGDGGQGIFQLIPGATGSVDDDGITITNAGGSLVWRRLLDGFIDGRWFGMVYGSLVSQVIYLNKALAASALYDIPLRILGPVFIDSVINVPAGSQLVCDEGGIFTASLSVTMNFPSTSNFEAVGGTFGQFIQPKFATNATSQVKVSWFSSASDDDRLARLIASPATGNTTQLLSIDNKLNITASSTTTNPIQFIDSGFFTISATGAITINYPKIIAGVSQIFSPNAYATYSFGSQEAIVEWFGAVGDGSTDSTASINNAFSTGNVLLSDNKIYNCTSSLTLPATLAINGNGGLKLQNTVTLSCTTLYITTASILPVYSTNWGTFTNFYATDALFTSKYTATNVRLSGCVYSDDTRNPVYAGSPALYNPHIPTSTLASVLGTDSNAKVIARNAGNPLLYAGSNWELVNRIGGTTQIINRIRYLNGKLFALMNLGQIYYSNDLGSTWNQCNTGSYTAYLFQDMIYTGTTYIATAYDPAVGAGNYSKAFTSTDGITFTQHDIYDGTISTVGIEVRTIGYNSDYSKIFVGGVGSNNTYYVSTNQGASWTSTVIYAGAFAYTSRAFAGVVNGTWVLCDSSGNVFTSSTGLANSWTKIGGATATTDFVLHISYNASTALYTVIRSSGYVTQGTSIYDAVLLTGSWIIGIIPEQYNNINFLYDVVNVNGFLVAVGGVDNQRVWTSNTGRQWSARTIECLPSGNKIRGVTAVVSNGVPTLYGSTDSINTGMATGYPYIIKAL